jgi:16S rRNA (cytosine1402-N4)-methyltransferase
MCKQCVDALLQCHRAKSGESSLIFVDGTLGGGGHSAAMLERLRPGDVLFGCDVDPAALNAASKRLAPFISPDTSKKPLFVPVQCNFRNLALISTIRHPITRVPIEGVDGILLDLGTSSHQINTASRGFSFRLEGPLDMRMGENGLSAADVCNQFNEKDLCQIFLAYGDEPRARSIAQSIVKHRSLATTNDLVQAVAAVVPKRSKTLKRLGRSATLARIFQCLRIVVNHEDVALEKALTEMCPTLVRPGGRLVVLSYHSMEDRAVMRVTRDGSAEWSGYQEDETDLSKDQIGLWKPVGKRRRTCAEERKLNRRARSAVLRVAERLETK